jgi:hypothetical protein
MHRSDAPRAQEVAMTQDWIINDERTYRCTASMKRNGGRWMPGQGWVFTSESDCANALTELYRVTRATPNQRACLWRMIADGTAHVSWDMNLDELEAWWAEELEDREAGRLISLGAQARRMLGLHPLEDLPEPVGDDHFDTSTFERQAQERRDRVRGAA